MSDEKATPIRRPGKGKGKALNAIAAASGRDPAAIVKSVTEAEAKAAAAVRAQQEEEARRIAEIEAAKEAKAREEVTTSQLFHGLSPQEQYRFECYRRCGFASRPIEKFVAKMLVEEAEKRYLVRRGAMVGLGGKMSGDIGNSSYDVLNSNNNTASVQDNTSDANQNKKRRKQSTKHTLKEESKRRRIAMDQPLPYFGSSGNSDVNNGNGSGSGTKSGQTPPLSNLVVSNSASEIVAVVSTLAKCYAQRLVSAAKRVADAEEVEQKMKGEDGTTDTDTTSSSSVSTITATPLQPHHFLEAHRHRARAGLDPGFWMASEGVGTRSSDGLGYNQGAVGIVEAAALGIVDRDRENYLAALEAQECCDHKAAKTGEEEKEQENEEGKEEQQDVSDKMEIDEDEGDEVDVGKEKVSNAT